MVARFGEVWAERGFDDEDLLKPWLMVPLKKFNYVFLHNGKGLNLKFDQSRLSVREIKGKNKSTAIENIAAAEAKRDDPTEGDLIESSYDAFEALYRLSQASTSRLFAIRGKRGGLTSIDALDGRMVKASLSVSVHPEKMVMRNVWETRSRITKWIVRK